MRPDAPPTPEEIARAFVLQQAQAAAEPGTKQDGNRFAGEIYPNYLATLQPDTAWPGLLTFIGNLAEEAWVTHEGRGPTVRSGPVLPGVNVNHGVIPAPRSGPVGHGAIEPVTQHLASKLAGIEH